MTETLEFYLLDHLKSRTARISGTGSTVEVIAYDIWGVSSSPNASFTGKQSDADGRVYYFNARYYDPVIGRFLTEDPSRNGNGWYAYCNDDPINKVDPDGRGPITLAQFLRLNPWYFAGGVEGVIMNLIMDKVDHYAGEKTMADLKTETAEQIASKGWSDFKNPNDIGGDIRIFRDLGKAAMWGLNEYNNIFGTHINKLTIPFFFLGFQLSIGGPGAGNGISSEHMVLETIPLFRNPEGDAVGRNIWHEGKSPNRNWDTDPGFRHGGLFGIDNSNPKTVDSFPYGAALHWYYDETPSGNLLRRMYWDQNFYKPNDKDVADAIQKMKDVRALIDIMNTGVCSGQIPP
jgi:RHS repeat-associated protein